MKWLELDSPTKIIGWILATVFQVLLGMVIARYILEAILKWVFKEYI